METLEFWKKSELDYDKFKLDDPDNSANRYNLENLFSAAEKTYFKRSKTTVIKNWGTEDKRF